MMTTVLIFDKKTMTMMILMMTMTMMMTNLPVQGRPVENILRAGFGLETQPRNLELRPADDVCDDFYDDDDDDHDEYDDFYYKYN